MKLEEIKQQVRSVLQEKRYQHSENVAKLAQELATIYGYDPEKAYLAGIVHDVCKNMSEDKQFTMLCKSGIIFDSVLQNSPKLWHAVTGAWYIQKKFEIYDEEIIQAVRYHTTGKSGMNLLDKILFVADLVSEDRTYSGAEELRNLSKVNLNAVLEEGLCFTICDLVSQKAPVHPDTLAAYNEQMMVKMEG